MGPGNYVIRAINDSGNSGYGVSFMANSLESVAQGNYIGTNIAGTGAVPNGLSGVNLGNALSVTIGGTAAGAGNVISGNLTNGIFVQGSAGALIGMAIIYMIGIRQEQTT